jgi:hypothetical protein
MPAEAGTHGKCQQTGRRGSLHAGREHEMR